MTELKIEDVSYNEEMKTLFHPTFYQEYIKVNGCIMPKVYSEMAEEMLDFEVRDDDVFVITFPKSGTTWVQEMVWCIVNDVNVEKSKQSSLFEKFPFLEIYTFYAENAIQSFNTNIREMVINTLEFTKNQQGQRCIKTHMPLHLIPRQLQSAQRKAKVVYVARDPRDTCISYYHFKKTYSGYTGDFSTFIRLFLDDKIPYAPYWQHVLGYWSIRHEPNVLFITYEEMKKDLPAVIERVATFLDKTLSPDQVATLTEHLSFESMKDNPTLNYGNLANIVKGMHGMNDGNTFMRSGKSGVFLSDMSKEEISLFDAWCRKNLENTDYTLPEFEDKDHFKI